MALRAHARPSPGLVEGALDKREKRGLVPPRSLSPRLFHGTFGGDQGADSQARPVVPQDVG